MRTNKEIRAAARAALFHTRSGARAMSAMLFLSLACGLALLLLGQLFAALGVETFDQLVITYERRVFSLARNTVLFAIAASLFARFIQAVFSGIQSFGYASAALYGACQAQEGIFRAAFKGFKLPLGLFALIFGFAIRLLIALMPLAFINIVILALMGYFHDWCNEHLSATIIGLTLSCLATFAALIVVMYVVYRYRFIWYLKVSDPTKSANWCFKESARRMDGLKMLAFKLDCLYWMPILLLILLAFVGVLPIAPDALRAICLMVLAPVLGFFLMVNMEFAHVIFYLESQDNKSKAP